MSRPRIKSAMLLPAIVGALTAATISTAQATPSQTEAITNRRIISYSEAHPDDFVGLDTLTRKYTGKGVSVRFSDLSSPVDARTAQQHLTRSRSSSTGNQALAAAPVGAARLSTLPSNLFTVWIVQTPLMGPPSRVRITGRWDFKDTFAGQGPPEDVASLSFDMPGCVHMTGQSVSTYAVRGWNSFRGSLKNANVASKSPIWSIADRTVAFEDVADHGGAGVTLENFCTDSTPVGADFAYEFNSGGNSVVSVTAAWGLLEVNYSGGGSLEMQKGTAPIYLTL